MTRRPANWASRMAKVNAGMSSTQNPAPLSRSAFESPLSKQQVREAISANTLEDKLRTIPVQAGDMLYVDANTVHAMGPGLTILETQQYSDVTYRLYDYGRPRELHVDAGLAVTATETRAGKIEPLPMEGFTRLIASPYFVVDRFTLVGSSTPLGKHGKLQVLVALSDGCFVEYSTGISVPLLPGHAVVLPAEDIAYTLCAPFAAQRLGRPPNRLRCRWSLATS